MHDKKLITKRSLRIGLCLLTLLFAVGSTRAAIYTVTNTDDSGAGSLRDMTAQANASADNDTINFNLSGCPCVITLTSGELTIVANGTLTINGLGADQLSISGNNTNRVFFIEGGADVTINDITVIGGNSAPVGGGGIFNFGTLSLTNSTVSNNSGTFGGGIYNLQATLMLTNSNVSNNSATDPFGAGGIYNFNGTVTLTKSTINNNSATNGDGGGIYNHVGMMTVINSTVSSNFAALNGGGIYNADMLMLSSSTVSDNMASQGGGIINSSTAAAFGTTNLSNTIIANSASGGDCALNSGTINAEYSLIEDNLDCVNGTNGNNLTGDPLLGLLQDNGGPTFTHALLAGSPAVDMGNSTEITDQRGFSRPVDDPASPNGAGNLSDIGSFEGQLMVGGVPTTKDQCKNGGWLLYSSPRIFQNQGDCIQFINTGF